MDTIHKICLQLVEVSESKTELPGTLADHLIVKYGDFPEPGRVTLDNKIGILFGAAGSGRYRFNDREVEMCEGRMLLVLPEDDLVLLQRDPSYREHRGAFSVPFLRGVPVELPVFATLLKDLRTNPGLRLNSLSFAQIDKQLIGFRQAYNSIQPFRLEIIQRVFSIFLLGLAGVLEISQNKREYLQNMASRKQYYCEVFLDLAARHCHTERSVGFYADKMCLTPKYLSSLLKEVSGKTASEWVDEFVLSEARKLLKSSVLSVQQIAYTLNFPNPSFFGRYFKNHTGISPLRYRVGSHT